MLRRTRQRGWRMGVRMALEVGETAPDCELLRPDGTALRLSAFDGRPLVVIFLRHLA